MPTYDYYCPTNQQTLRVEHRMSESMTTWGEACERIGMEAGDTPADAPVERLMSLAAVDTKGSGHVHSAGCGCGCPSADNGTCPMM